MIECWECIAVINNLRFIQVIILIFVHPLDYSEMLRDLLFLLELLLPRLHSYRFPLVTHVFRFIVFSSSYFICGLLSVPSRNPFLTLFLAFHHSLVVNRFLSSNEFLFGMFRGWACRWFVIMFLLVLLVNIDLLKISETFVFGNLLLLCGNIFINALIVSSKRC